MANIQRFLSLDVGEKRIGVALADSQVRIAVPEITLEVDGSEVNSIERMLRVNSIDVLVVGLPRSQNGKISSQTDFVKEFMAKINLPENVSIEYQDESLTSVIAEERLKSRSKNYQKGDIDKEAAAIILTDYLESKKWM